MLWNRIKILFLVLLVLICCLGCEPTDRSEIKIGAVASLTGPAGEQGKNWLNGARLAAADLNRRGISCLLIVEDDATSPSKAVASLQKLASLDRVSAVIGGTWDYLAESSFPAAKRLRMPFITPTNPAELLSAEARSNEWVFTNAMSVAAEAQALRLLFQSLRPRSIALIYPNLPWGVVHADAVAELAKELSIPLVYRDAFPFEGYLDGVRVAALHAAESQAELVYAPIDYSGILLVAEEFRRLKLHPYLIVSQHLDTALKLAKPPDLLDRAFGIYPETEDPEFEDAYRTMFGEGPRVYAAAGYDAMMFLVLALRSGANLSANDARFEYDGVTGKHQLPSIDRSLVKGRAMVTAVKNGQMTPWKPGRAG